jgi:hypothetical protein
MKRKILDIMFLVWLCFLTYCLILKLGSLNEELKKLKMQFDILLDEKVATDFFIKQRIDLIQNYTKDKVLAIRILKAIKKYSDIYQLDPDLVFSIIFKESCFNYKAVSPKGAIGLMQILPETGELVSKYLGKVFYDLFEIEDNIEIGCAYLSLLLQYNNQNISVVLRKYYAGKFYNMQEAEEYAKSILAFYRGFTKEEE